MDNRDKITGEERRQMNNMVAKAIQKRDNAASREPREAQWGRFALTGHSKEPVQLTTYGGGGKRKYKKKSRRSYQKKTRNMSKKYKKLFGGFRRRSRKGSKKRARKGKK